MIVRLFWLKKKADQHPVQMLSMEKNGVTLQGVKMEMVVSIVTLELSSSSILKFTNLLNAMTCRLTVIVLEVRFVDLLTEILKLLERAASFR